MAETLQKLRPDRDLQCYFERPSAIAAISGASAYGFTLSGCWRQQNDWAVIEWNRDNVFEHPSLRNLPDGDLSGIQLSYEEVRTNCIALDSALYPTVAWPHLRIWTEDCGAEPYYVPLSPHATPIEGAYTSATAEFELQGSPTAGDYIELAWLDEHYNYQVGAQDSLESAVAALAEIITQGSQSVSASSAGDRITLSYSSAKGAEANRIGVYGTEHGVASQSWQPRACQFSGGQSPSKWRIDLDFGSLHDLNDQLIPTHEVRKMRWTWAAALQLGDFQRGEFSVLISNWTVTGTSTGYLVAGPGSRRVEDDAGELTYSPGWAESRGNFSGGSIRYSTTAGAYVLWNYTAAFAHRLYLGTRRAESAGNITVQVDGGAPRTVDLHLAGEDVLVRIELGEMSGPGAHRVRVTHSGASESCLYFDFFEITVAVAELPEFPDVVGTTLATDWDTDHSIAIAPERTAWLIRKLGFSGRANHYAGALWFYELVRPGHEYAKASIDFVGIPEWSKTTQIWLGPTLIEHVNLIGDTAETIATCFALLINAGATGVWATADGTRLTITARAMGEQGNGLSIAVNTNSSSLTADPVNAILAGGKDGTWTTDLVSTPRLNRAARDWSRSFFTALSQFGIQTAAAFSMELQHGDARTETGIAQRYPDGSAAWLNTPALQTNFSPASLAFWQQAYTDMAKAMMDAGIVPYLQFGEVQWWYFANPFGMPFYDDYTKTSFEQRYGRPMQTITSQFASPEPYTAEAEHLSGLIGQFTDSIMAYVRRVYPNAMFEVLYPPDVNETPLNRLVNFPLDHWTPGTLRCLKTENFTYTGDRNLDKAKESIVLPAQLGFAPDQSSHLVGIGEYTTPWLKEHRMAQAEGLESVVLFALDQFCLIGYGLPLDRGMRRAVFLGS